MRYDNNPSNLLRRSDQWPFLQKAVPSLFFHTGLHPDYHTEFDVPERIEYAKLERIARLVHQLSWDLANASESAGVRQAGPGGRHPARNNGKLPRRSPARNRGTQYAIAAIYRG